MINYKPLILQWGKHILTRGKKNTNLVKKLKLK